MQPTDNHAKNFRALSTCNHIVACKHYDDQREVTYGCLTKCKGHKSFFACCNLYHLIIVLAVTQCLKEKGDNISMTSISTKDIIGESGILVRVRDLS